jgi:hypothetical protein
LKWATWSARISLGAGIISILPYILCLLVFGIFVFLAIRQPGSVNAHSMPLLVEVFIALPFYLGCVTGIPFGSIGIICGMLALAKQPRPRRNLAYVGIGTLLSIGAIIGNIAVFFFFYYVIRSRL